MNAIDSRLHPATAHTDSEGRITAADPRILDLVSRAGGGIGYSVPQPAIAAMVRLAARLGIAVTRGLVVADGEDDLDLYVRVEPGVGGVTMLVSGWTPRPAWRGLGSVDDSATEFAATAPGWRWETDAALRVTHVATDAAARYGIDLRAVLGAPLHELFALSDDGGAKAGSPPPRFDTQRAQLVGGDCDFDLSATPRIDGRGRFAGFVGRAEPVTPVADDDDDFSAGFAAQLDRSLRRPLERIIANAGSMSAELDGPLAASYVGYAQDIAQAGRHLLGLVDDLVDLEAVERADFAIEPEPIDLADVARRAAGLLTVRASDGGRPDRAAARSGAAVRHRRFPAGAASAGEPDR